ncbi:hypothetical protein V5799_000863 [Amblyomma americanum]|uniref:Uncharacterized protein n=1 Tax=Amblyomma americanum TaxID=6943 RepID=A0AAQ4D1U1_AMBAM
MIKRTGKPPVQAPSPDAQRRPLYERASRASLRRRLHIQSRRRPALSASGEHVVVAADRLRGLAVDAATAALGSETRWIGGATRGRLAV